MLCMETGDLRKQNIECLKNYYLNKIKEVQNELDEIIKLKQMIYPFTDEHTLTIKFVPTHDLDKTMELIFRRIELEVKKQFGLLRKKENKND